MHAAYAIVFLALLNFQNSLPYPSGEIYNDEDEGVQNDVESQIGGPMMDDSVRAQPLKAGEPTPGDLTGGMIPGPTDIKDRIPGGSALPNMANSSAADPTLLIGGFSVLMMPMSRGANMAQLAQVAPIMSMIPSGRK